MALLHVYKNVHLELLHSVLFAANQFLSVDSSLVLNI